MSSPPGASTDGGKAADKRTGQWQMRERVVPRYPFWFGGSASSFAATVTHPLDLIKVRLQTRTGDGPKGMFGTFTHILRNDGLRGLYNGLSASLLRQITYSTTRFGVYEELKSLSSTPNPSLAALIVMASTSGFLGGLAGNPADVLNVRMQHDAALPASQRRNYANAIDGLLRMTREEGFRSLFRGVWPNSLRAVLMTASQLASYDFFKTLLTTKRAGAAAALGLREDHPLTHFLSSTGAGFVATTICSPVDVLKTRIMSAAASEGQGRGGAGGVLRLLGTWYRAEGVGWLFKGWVPSFVRLGPHTVVTFLFLEQHKRLWRMLNHAEVE